MRHYAARGKRDAAEPAVVKALEALGWRVLRISVKDGPDLVAAKQGCGTVCIEVKTGTQTLRPGQRHWVASWPGEARLMRTAEDAIALNREYDF